MLVLILVSLVLLVLILVSLILLVLHVSLILLVLVLVLLVSLILPLATALSSRHALKVHGSLVPRIGSIRTRRRHGGR